MVAEATSRRLPRGQLEAELAFLLMALVERQRGNFFSVVARHELSPPQWGALKELLFAGPMPMRQLAEHMSCDASNITGISDRLEVRGLLERRSDPQDRRVKTLALTEAGRRLATSVLDELVSGGWAAVLTEQEKQILHGLLVKVVGELPQGVTPCAGG
jgi:DNA-binding MarR family transcriptional regulator